MQLPRDFPGTKIDMRGSGDDVTRMYNCLIEEYGFSENDITVLVDTDHSAAATAEPKSECDKLKRKLEKKEKHIERLTHEKDDAVQLAKGQVEEISQKFAAARKDAEIAENGRIKVKKELEKKEELVKSLKLKCQEISQSAARKVEEMHQELVNARKNADIAENKWIKVNEELQEKLELVQLLQLKCDELRQSAMREVEEKELEFASILDAAINATSSSVVAEIFMALYVVPEAY